MVRARPASNVPFTSRRFKIGITHKLGSLHHNKARTLRSPLLGSARTPFPPDRTHSRRKSCSATSRARASVRAAKIRTSYAFKARMTANNPPKNQSNIRTGRFISSSRDLHRFYANDVEASSPLQSSRPRISPDRGGRELPVVQGARLPNVASGIMDCSRPKHEFELTCTESSTSGSFRLKGFCSETIQNQSFAPQFRSCRQDDGSRSARRINPDYALPEHNLLQSNSYSTGTSCVKQLPFNLKSPLSSKNNGVRAFNLEKLLPLFDCI
jgi:hypothetical protein